jgi:hypothetical protein
MSRNDPSRKRRAREMAEVKHIISMARLIKKNLRVPNDNVMSTLHDIVGRVEVQSGMPEAHQHPARTRERVEH